MGASHFQAKIAQDIQSMPKDPVRDVFGQIDTPTGLKIKEMLNDLTRKYRIDNKIGDERGNHGC